MKEREAEALKRKRGEEDEEVDDEGASKRQKSNDGAHVTEARRREQAAKKKEKRERKKERNAQKKAKAEAKKARKQERDLAEARAEQQQNPQGENELNHAAEDGEQSSDAKDVDFSGFADAYPHELNDAASIASSAPTTPRLDSPSFDVATNHSASSSSSSITPIPIEDQPTLLEQPTRPTSNEGRRTPLEPKERIVNPADSGIASPKLNLPRVPHAEAQERLRKRIEMLRAQRKADDTDGNPAKSRQELVEQRRKRDEQRKAAKKAQRQKEKEDESRRTEEHLRGSGSPLSADIFSSRSPQPRESSNNYSFSRLAFEDGTAADPSLSHLQDAKKQKGPQDPKTALQVAQSKQSRISGYDAEKSADIAEKDMWLNARKRAHGERVRDDTNLLKKALKRKEKQKSKSEREWKDREDAVVKGREMKQKKREANLQKRKEEKGGAKGKKKKAGGGKKKKRPGFEGRFKA